MDKVYLVLIVVGLLFIGSVTYSYMAFTDGFPWGDKIAVIEINGPIDFGPMQNGVAPVQIASLIKEAEENPSVKAIVLEINSPGGSPVSSDEIARAVRDAEKPTVAWLGDIAASGGYWIAASADKIVAHPMSVTGSIGAFSLLVELSDLMDDVGVNVEYIQSAEYKSLGSPFHNATDEEKQILLDMVLEIHEQFVQTVAESRGMDVEAVRKIADGRPFSGRTAYELGLVDSLGNEQDAIELAKELGGVEGEPEIIRMQPKKPLFLDLFSTPFTLAKGVSGLEAGNLITT
ncbi:MAG: signal peptide peptidase SppA [archaeon]